MKRNGRTPISSSSTSAPSTPARTASSGSFCSSTARRSSTSFPDIGYHHRGAEKMGERQSWHTFIPYTDRIDYLAGRPERTPLRAGRGEAGRHRGPRQGQGHPRHAGRALPHASATLSGTAPSPGHRGHVSRSSTCSTTGSAIFDIIEAVAGGRMHPVWFRIGGVAQDLPEGWDGLVRDFLKLHAPGASLSMTTIVMKNRIFKVRTRGHRDVSPGRGDRMGRSRGRTSAPAGSNGTSERRGPTQATSSSSSRSRRRRAAIATSRAVVRVEEMRQSLRIIEQCLKNMPRGPLQVGHPSPPRR